MRLRAKHAPPAGEKLGYAEFWKLLLTPEHATFASETEAQRKFALLLQELDAIGDAENAGRIRKFVEGRSAGNRLKNGGAA